MAVAPWIVSDELVAPPAPAARSLRRRCAGLDVPRAERTRARVDRNRRQAVRAIPALRRLRASRALNGADD